MAAHTCDVGFSHADPSIELPACTYDCFMSEGTYDHYDATCSDNLQGHCRLRDGVQAYFAYYSSCLLLYCPRDGDRYDFVEAFQEQCASVGPESSITSISGAFGAYLTRPSSMTSVVMSTILLTIRPSAHPSSPSTFPTLKTSTILQETTSSTSTSASTSASAELPEMPHSQPPTETMMVTIFSSINTQSATISRVPSSLASSPASPSPIPPSRQAEDRPILPLAATIGISAGGGVSLILIILGIVYFIRKKRRSHAAESSDVPPLYEPYVAGNYDKSEPSGQKVAYESVGSAPGNGKFELSGENNTGSTSVPAGFTELDGVSTPPSVISFYHGVR